MAKLTKRDTSSYFLNCLIFREEEVNCEVVDKTFDVHVLLLNYIIRWRSISMRARLAFLQFDWSKASLSVDLPVFVYSHTKTGFKFFQCREDIGSYFMFLEIFDFKPRRALVLSRLKSVKVY